MLGRRPHDTAFRGMHQVRPGHIVRVTREDIQQISYWQLTNHVHNDDVPTTVRRVRELLEDTIQRQLIADVPVCTLLSGGLDSSAMTAMAARFSDKRIPSFALNFVGYAENFIPARCARYPTGLTHKKSPSLLVPTTRKSCCHPTNSWTAECGPALYIRKISHSPGGTSTAPCFFCLKRSGSIRRWRSPEKSQMNFLAVTLVSRHRASRG